MVECGGLVECGGEGGGWWSVRCVVSWWCLVECVMCGEMCCVVECVMCGFVVKCGGVFSAKWSVWCAVDYMV